MIKYLNMIAHEETANQGGTFCTVMIHVFYSLRFISNDEEVRFIFPILKQF